MPFMIADIYNHADMLKAAQELVLKYGDDIDIPVPKDSELTATI